MADAEERIEALELEKAILREKYNCLLIISKQAVSNIEESLKNTRAQVEETERLASENASITQAHILHLLSWTF